MRHDHFRAQRMAWSVGAAVLALLIGGIAPALAGSDLLTSCQVYRGKEVSFRDHRSQDLLEISVGGGPCLAATLVIVVKTFAGDIVYSYIAPLERQAVGDWDSRNLPASIAAFVERAMEEAIRSTSSLPPYANAKDFGFNIAIQISESDYERLRAENRPMLVHLTGYETWQYVVYDPRLGTPRIVVTDGL